MIEVVEFILGQELYAIDIHLAREIVDMMPMTPVPRGPVHISGLINLRGEITNIIDLTQVLNLSYSKDPEGRQIIVLMPEVADGSNAGIMVDEVYSVISTSESNVESINDEIASEISEYVKGIIKIKSNESETEDKLIIWIDIKKIINNLLEKVQ